MQIPFSKFEKGPKTNLKVSELQGNFTDIIHYRYNNTLIKILVFQEIRPKSILSFYAILIVTSPNLKLNLSSIIWELRGIF